MAQALLFQQAVNSSTRSIAAAVALGFCVTCSGCALFVAGAAGGGAAGAAASVKDDHRHSPTTYTGTVLANMGYVPAKIVFALAGAAASGVAYVITVGDSDRSNAIWDASVGGNYILTPGMIAGEEPVHFVTSDHGAIERRV